MRRLGLVLPAPEHREEGVPESNRRWATDLTTVWTRRDGLVAVVLVIDCGERMVLDYEVTTSQESPTVLARSPGRSRSSSGGRGTSQMGLSFEATMVLSTRAGTARSCASAGDLTTLSRQWAVPRAMRSPSGSS